MTAITAAIGLLLVGYGSFMLAGHAGTAIGIGTLLFFGSAMVKGDM